MTASADKEKNPGHTAASAPRWIKPMPPVTGQLMRLAKEIEG